MKMRRMYSLLLWSLLAAVCAGNSAIAEPAKQSAAVLTHDLEHSVYYLASEELEGRGVGTRGLELAAEYIAEVFSQAGLQPLPGHDDYFQPFEMTAATTIGPDSALRFDGEDFVLGEDFIPTSFAAEQSFAGEVVFVGYGISSEEYGYDDYAEAGDVSGKIVLAMRFEPHDERGRSRFVEADWSDEATIVGKSRTAARHGAAALLLVNPPEHHGEDDVLMPFGSRFRDHVAGIPVVQITREAADRLLQQAGAPQLRGLQREIDESGQPNSIALEGVHVSGNVSLSRTTPTVKNVMGLLPGEGDLADQFIVVGAHYDHLGRGLIGSRLRGSTEIHYGADDNASGTAVMLEMAVRLAAQGRGGRSIIFIGFTAEEWGLLGSQHFVNNPPVPLENIVAMLNMDMVGRVRGNLLHVGGAGQAEVFGPILDRAAEASPLTISRMGRGGFGASDHVSFNTKRIPALFLFSGLHADYHRPGDTADRINYEGLAYVADFATDVVAQLAQEPARPTFVEGAGLPRFLRGMQGSERGLGRASLGVVPDYAVEPPRGVRISGVSPDSPAEQARLKGGDVIIRFDDREIENLYDLTEALGASRPGDDVRLGVLRDGEEIEIEATLGRR